ncbi:hypothetical protein K504DRAFT_451530 [Pleomassaria siparia CBS 279.74]|uniref:Uncharacterized protein n=1 Tax=Pleomassaria siparia CBS 279.74 TaxID=1314801 RepID=A0A6G1JTS3_9PLEO|nr:hypothetical protein K504DRAFT_451530 [Pleomassaria siparia CBS 279.74]
MPVWPFGRRKPAKLKEGTAVADGSERKRPAASNSDALKKVSSRRNSRRKRMRSRSTTSMRDVDKFVPIVLPPLEPPFGHIHPLLRPSVEDTTALALPYAKHFAQSPHLRPVTQYDATRYNFQNTPHSSLPTARERGKLQRPQSLRRAVNEVILVRRKSTKKREHDYVREEEIRAMSTMPLSQKRPAGHIAGMLHRDSKKVKGALNHRLERPMSNTSLPIEDSIHSSTSGGSESRAFRVSAFDMFSPRPKLRYSVGSQYYYGGAGPSPTSDQEKGDVRRQQRITFSRNGMDDRRSSRIDELADTLDAGALREIMDRDKRRQEKKKKADQDRLRRRLERRAEKQRLAEGGTPASPRRDARGALGLGIDQERATSVPEPVHNVRPLTPMEHVRASTPPRQPSRIETAVHVPTTLQNNQLPTPLDSPVEEPVVSDAKAVHYSRGSVLPPVHAGGPSNTSQMPALLSEMVAQDSAIQAIEPAQDPKTSGSLHAVVTADTKSSTKSRFGRRRSSEGRRMSAFTSFFRRGSRKRDLQDASRPATPSEVSFSNTSRESMSRGPMPAHLVVPPAAPVQIRRPSGAPHRTMSKFREDLPEFPLSPPDSRMHSPEDASANAIAARPQSRPPPNARVYSNSPHRTDSPVSPGVPATGIMSQSLASVDSEASWLSGKPLQRRSNKSHIRSSVGSSTLKQNDEFNPSYEELGIPDDEYFPRPTLGLDERHKSETPADVLARKASSTVMVASDDEEQRRPIVQRTSEDENLVKIVIGRRPTIVHRQARHKSTEGLLSFCIDKADADKQWPEEQCAIVDEADHEGSPHSLESPLTLDGEPMLLQRAHSVEVGKRHARKLSAGSAKLLDIPKRASTPTRTKAIAEV